jgi:hypothetical protein
MLRKAAIAILALTLACSDSDPTPPPDPGSIQVAVNPGNVSIPVGGSGSASVTVTRNGSFNGNVSVIVTGLPAGVVASANPTTLPANTTTTSINVAVGAAVAPGIYSGTVTGIGDGVAQATTTLQVTVTPPPSFTLSVPAGGLVIASGASGTLNVAVQRTNFTGPIELALLNPPSGITATLTPSSSTGNSALLTLIVSPGAAQGTIPLILRGRAPGMTDRTVTFDLTVRAPVAGNRVEYMFCDVASAPVFFAYQDGTGAWQAVAPAGLGNTVQFAFDITSGYGGVAMVFATSSSGSLVRGSVSPLQASARRLRADAYETVVLYATTPQLVEDGIDMCAATQPTITATVNVSGVPVGSYGILSFGNTTQIFNPADNPSGNVTFDGAKSGLNDFVAARTTPQNAPDRIILARNLSIANGGTIPPINFNTTPALTPATAQVTITGTNNDPLETFVELITANNHQGLWMELASSPATTRTWAGLRQEDMMSTDFHSIIVFASAQNESGDFRVTQRFVDFVTNQTLAMGPLISLPNITQLPSSTRLRFQGSVPAEYDRGVGFTVADTLGTGNSAFVAATTGYLAAVGNASTYDLSMPDLAALTGFPGAALLATGFYAVAIDAYGFNGPGVFNPRPVRGGEFKAAVRHTSVTIN